MLVVTVNADLINLAFRNSICIIDRDLFRGRRLPSVLPVSVPTDDIRPVPPIARDLSRLDGDIPTSVLEVHICLPGFRKTVARSVVDPDGDTVRESVSAWVRPAFVYQLLGIIARMLPRLAFGEVLPGHGFVLEDLDRAAVRRLCTDRHLAMPGPAGWGCRGCLVPVIFVVREALEIHSFLQLFNRIVAWPKDPERSPSGPGVPPTAAGMKT